MALGIFIFNEAFNTSISHIKNDLLTLMQSYKRTPNIFYASSSKSKNQSCILSIFIKKKQAFAEALNDISFQNDLYVLHGRSPSKDTIISKIHTFFYNFKHSVETLSV